MASYFAPFCLTSCKSPIPCRSDGGERRRRGERRSPCHARAGRRNGERICATGPCAPAWPAPGSSAPCTRARRGSPGATLAGVATSTPERSREAAARLGAAEAYATPEELATADDVDVLHICTPNHLHAGLAALALAHGKHVVCEKPLAVGTEQAAELIEAARAADRVATVPFVYRFHPVVREARARVRAGALGPVRLIHGGYLQDWLASADDDNWRIDADLGGPSRAFADIGSHWCDLVEFITGDRIAALCAQTATVFPERASHAHAQAFAGAPAPATASAAP